MTRKRTVSVLAATAALALPIAACGEDDKFIDEYNDVGAKALKSLGSDLGTSASQAKSPKEAEKVYGRLADRTENLVDDLKGLDPPQDAKASYDELVGALESVGGHLEEVADAAGAGNTQKANAAIQKLQQDGTKIAAAESELKKKVED